MNLKPNEDGVIEKMHYDETEDRVVVETIYDATTVIEENAAIRQDAPIVVGEKGQELVLAMRLPKGHIVKLKNEGYDLFSPDKDEARRAMLYVQQNQHKFLTTDKKMIAERKQAWR
ncbi:MAG: hypothetical protein H7255_14545 [Ramlibacter sp.]|nr:hypothetical protein [Ramlibacter sp.]